MPYGFTPNPKSDPMTFWEELKRRRVVRVTIAYAAVAFGLVQGADAFVPALHLPPQTTTYVAVAALIGLPIAIILAWMFQLSPSGLTRDDGTTVPAPWPVKRTIAAVGIVAIAGVAAFYLMPRAKPLDPNRVMVARFVDRTGDASLSAVGSMAADWITQGITQAQIADVVDPAALAGDAVARAAGSSDPIADARAMNAGTVVTGSYYRQGDSLYINAKITDANDGHVITSLDVNAGRVSEPVGPVTRVRDRVLIALGAYLAQGESKTILAARLPSYEAYRVYRDARASGDLRVRLAGLKRAVASDTSFDMARLFELHTYAMLRDFAGVDSVTRVLDAKRDKLTPVEQALFDRHRAWASGDLEGTYKAAKKLAAIMPGSRTASLEALRMNRPREAIEEAERMPVGMRRERWEAYYNPVISALHMMGDYRGEQRKLRESREYFPFSAVTLEENVRVLVALGRIEDARVQIQNASALPRDDFMFRALMKCALEMRAHGFTEDSRRLLEDVLAEMRSAWTNDLRGNYNQALYYAGHYDAVLARIDSLRADTIAFGRGFTMLGMYGSIHARRGNRAEAVRIMKQLNVVDDSTQIRMDRTTPHLWRARIAAQLGDRDEALRILRDDVRLVPGPANTGTHVHIDPDLAPLKGWKPFDDFIKPKG